MTELYMWIVVIFLLVIVLVGQLIMLSKFLMHGGVNHV